MSLSLYSSLNSKTNIFDNLDNSEFDYFREILKLPPLEAIEEVIKVISSCGWRDFVDLLVKFASPGDHLQILGLFLGSNYYSLLTNYSADFLH